MEAATERGSSRRGGMETRDVPEVDPDLLSLYFSQFFSLQHVTSQLGASLTTGF